MSRIVLRRVVTYIYENHEELEIDMKRWFAKNEWHHNLKHSVRAEITEIGPATKEQDSMREEEIEKIKSKESISSIFGQE